jgi:hypothetical protein
MTFNEFQQHCDQVASTNVPLQLPCPIVIGDGNVRAALGDSINHQIVIFKMTPDGAALQSLYRQVRFSFAASTNQVVIAPLTTGA